MAGGARQRRGGVADCEDFDKLIALSDRVVVMAGGRLVDEAPVAEADIRATGERMAGH